MDFFVVSGCERKTFRFGKNVLADLLLPYFDYGLRGNVFLENLTVDYVF